MKKLLTLSAALVSIVALLPSCKKSEDATCVSGSGGSTQIVVYGVRNGDTIIHSAQQPDTAFVSWSNSGDAAAYDKLYIAEAGEDHIHLSSLNCGSYRIRLSVFDSVSMTRYTGTTTVSYTKTSGEVTAAVVFP